MKRLVSIKTVIGVLLLVLTVGAVAAVAGPPGKERVRYLNPAKVNLVPQASFVYYDAVAKTFVELRYDRGVVKAVDAAAGKLTITQSQAGVTWRETTFTVPSTARIVVRNRVSTLANVAVGDHARVLQTGPPGGALSVIEVRAGLALLPLPATS